MAEYTNDLRIKEIGIGEEAGAWGTTLNTQLSLLAEGFSYGVENLGSDANATITMANGASDEARSLYLKITSTSLSATRTVTLAPESVSKVWIIENATTGSQSITITQGGGQHGVTIPNGQVKMIYTTGDSESPSGAYDALDNLELGGNATAVTSVTAPLIEASTSIQTPLIEFTDGDDAITIADGGGLTFSGTATGTVLKGTTSLQTPLIEFTDGDDAITIADGGGITAANGITSTAAANTFGATSFNDADITNVGSISLDTIVSDASPATVTIGYGTNDALNVNSKTVFGSTSQNGFVSIDPADGVADEAYALFVRNNEATDGRNYGLMVRAGSTSADESFSVRDHANAGTYFKVRGDGNVGIGTASPDNLLHIKTTGSTPSIELEQDAGTSYKGLIKLAGNDLEIRGSSGIMEFYTGNNDGDSSTLRMSISAAGTATFEHPIVTQSGATQGYYIENNAGNATTPRITNDANDHTVIRPGKSGGAVQWNNFANSAELMRLSDAGVLTIGSGGISESRVNQNFAITHAAERGGMAINSFYANASGPLF